MTTLPSAALLARADRDMGFGRVSVVLNGATERLVVHTPCPGASGEGDLVCVLPLRGRIAYTQDDQAGDIAPGGYVLLARSRFYDLSSDDDMLHWAVRMPASDLRARLPALDDHLAGRFAANPAMASLLGRVVATIVETFAEQSPPHPEALATEIIDFVALAVAAEDRGTSSAPRNARLRLRRRVLDYIDAHLGDGDLGPRMIADHHRVSLSYLYSLFSDNRTTVGHCIQAKRLQRAYEMLVADNQRALTVAEVAYRAGFKSVSHFSRSFSRHFSRTPREVRRSAGVA